MEIEVGVVICHEEIDVSKLRRYSVAFFGV